MIKQDRWYYDCTQLGSRSFGPPLLLSGSPGQVASQGHRPSAGQRRGDIEMVDYLDRGRGLTNLVLDLSFVHERHGASRADPQVNGKLTFADCKRVDQPLEDKDPQYTQDYANNTRSVFAPAVASTSGRIRGMFRALEEAFAIPHRPAFPQGRRSSFFATSPASSTRAQRAVPPSTQCLTKGGRKTCAASCLQR